jgi:ABC-type branched-subunit amino acid transport system ATPase component/ABC-type branched-subunit amino acid transport system permease subunit
MKPSRIVLIVLAVAAFVAPFTALIPGWTLGLATAVYCNALAAIGLNLIFGVTGMLALGQAAFMVVPAYCAGILDNFGVPFYLSVAAGVAVTLLLAKYTGRVFVRLPGIYLAVGTLGFGYFVEGVARAFPSFSGGASGLLLERGRDIGDNAWYVIASIALIAGTGVYLRLVRGAFWRRLRTINHDELAAAVLGIHVGKSKEQVFLIGAAFAIVAGLLRAYYIGLAIPEDGGVDHSLEQLAMVMVGGAGYVLGPIFGTAALQWLFVITAYAKSYVLLVYGAVFLVAVLYLKDGIAGWVAKGWHELERRLDGPEPSKPRVTPMQPAALPLIAADELQREGVCLAVSNVAKRFKGVLALDCVSFSVDFGEIFTIVGPNGAGKSTLFNIVSGIESPSSGAVKVAAKDLGSFSISERARFIGRSFQVARLVPDLTVVENILVRLDQIAPDLTENQRFGIAHDEIAAFGLASIADTAASRLSAGQHKLVDLTRAAVGNPALVLLDEPAVGLTADELEHLRSLLFKLRERGSAVVIVEHNIDFVAEVAQRGIVLDGGRPIAFGATKEILADEKVREAYFGALA